MRITSRLLSAALLAAAAVPASAFEAAGRALAFASAREGTSVFEPRVEIAALRLSIQPGDALEYDLLLPAPCADRAGVEIVFADGRRSEAAIVAGTGRWTRVRIALDSFAGAETARFEVVARGSLADEIGFRLDDVAVTRASGEQLVVFRETLQSGARLLRDDERHAGVMIAGADAGFDGVRTRIGPELVVEPWNAYDMTVARRGENAAGTGAPGPRGNVLAGPCVPLWFAPAGEPACVRATGQQFRFDPLEGGRFYTLWLAVSSADDAPIRARGAGLGDAGERCPFDIVVPAAGSVGETSVDLSGCRLLEIPIAARVPLHGIELPAEPRLLVHALTIQWRKDGIGDADFRLEWLAEQARTTRELSDLQRRQVWRYVRNRRLGPIFADIGADDEAERGLFAALVQGDVPAFETALSARLTDQSRRGAALSSLHIALEDARDGRAIVNVQCGVDEEALLRAFASIPGGRALVVQGDAGELQQAPQIMAALGLDAAILPSGPIAARWRGPDGSSVHVLAPPQVLSDAREFGDRDWRRWTRRARAGGASPEIFVAVPDEPASRADAALVAALCARIDCVPRVSIETAGTFLAHARERMGASMPEFELPPLAPVAGSDARRTSARISDWRGAARSLAELETWATIASMDGWPYPSALLVDLRSRIANSAFEDGRSTPVELAARVDGALVAALAVIARGANTLGHGTPIVAFNPLPWERMALLELDSNAATLTSSSGARLPSQPTASGTLLFALDLPALGYEVVHAARGAPAAADPGPARVVVQGSTARNNALAFTVDPRTGALASLALEPEHQELLAGPACFADGEWKAQSAAFVETGPLRAIARVTLTSPRGQAQIEFVLAARSKALEVRITNGVTDASAPLAWRVPLRHASAQAAVGVPFGFTTVGPLADGTPARHRLVDWIAGSDGRHGIAVLAGNCTSALVEPGALAPECAADTATTRFALAPFSGGWRKTSFAASAREFALQPRLLSADAHDGARAARHTFLSFTRNGADGRAVSGPAAGVVMTALQPAFDGDGWLARFTETSGNGAELSIAFDRPLFAAERVDLRGLPRAALRVEERRARLVLGSDRIETVRVRLRP